MHLSELDGDAGANDPIDLCHEVQLGSEGSNSAEFVGLQYDGFDPIALDPNQNRIYRH